MTQKPEYGEPWSYERERRLMTDVVGVTVCADGIAFAAGPRASDAEEKSLRISACVNALTGIPNEQIERDAKLYPHVREMEQRLKAVVEAGREYRKAHDLHGGGSMESGRRWDLWRRASDLAISFLDQIGDDQ